MPNIFDITTSLQENVTTVHHLLTDLKKNTHKPHYQILAAAEIRRHIEAARQIMDTATNIQAITAFEEIILDALSELDQTTRLRIMAKRRRSEKALTNLHGQTNTNAFKASKSTERSQTK